MEYINEPVVSESTYDLSVIRYGGYRHDSGTHLYAYKFKGPRGDVSYFFPFLYWDPRNGTSFWTISSVGVPIKSPREVHHEFRVAQIPFGSFNQVYSIIEQSPFDPYYNTPAEASESWAVFIAGSLGRADVITQREARRFEQYVDDVRPAVRC